MEEKPLVLIVLGSNVLIQTNLASFHILKILLSKVSLNPHTKVQGMFFEKSSRFILFLDFCHLSTSLDQLVCKFFFLKIEFFQVLFFAALFNILAKDWKSE